MPSSAKYKATRKKSYAQERRTAKRRGETGVGSKSSDAKRHRARRKVAKARGKAAIAGKDVDHKKPLKSGGSNSLKNLRVKSRSSNKSHGGKIGSRKGKAAGARKGHRSRRK